jgi:hypothetical protein
MVIIGPKRSPLTKVLVMIDCSTVKIFNFKIRFCLFKLKSCLVKLGKIRGDLEARREGKPDNGR